MKIIKNDIFDYKNRYIFQYEEGFKFSLDSVLLAEFVDNIKSNSKVVDLCSGNAVIPLILTTKFDVTIKCLEKQTAVYELAEKSILFNKLENKIEVFNLDIKDYKNVVDNNTVDVITCNPPFFKLNENSLLNKNDLLNIARHEVCITLEEIFSIVSKLLKSNGTFYLVHRAQRLDEILVFANKYNVNAKNIMFVSTKKHSDFNTVLIKFVKNSKLGVKIGYKEIFDLETYQNLFRKE